VRRMDTLLVFVDLFLHVDKHLSDVIQSMGSWTYVILFAVVFCETGLIVTPFLPGDSLLFAIGALCARGDLNMWIIVPLLIAAALMGDMVNYTVGHLVGPGFLEKEKVRFIKKAHLERTQAFYRKHGGKTIILARFAPIVRTFAPFVAGISRMPVARYATFCVIGAVSWITSLSFAGFVFGDIPWVKKNFTAVVLMIVAISLMPMFIEFLRHQREKRLLAKQPVA
jgi:membrane-associated protein